MAKTATKLVTQADYARSRKNRGLPGGSREAVRLAVDAQRISTFGPNNLIAPELADAQWEQNTRTRVSSANTPPPMVADDVPTTEPGYMQFRARREEADAQIAEMNAAKMRAAMLMREDVDRAAFEIARELRDRLTSCGRRIGPEVAAIATAEGCEAVIEREHRIVLELLASGLREKIGSPVEKGEKK